MSIRFKDKNEGTPTKEEMKLHIIENLIENRYCNYSNSELSDAMVDGSFKKIYDEIINRVFNQILNIEMIKFKEQKQTNSCVNNITNEEINLKIHKMLLDFYKGRDMFISDMWESIQKGTYKRIFTYIKEHIHD